MSMSAAFIQVKNNGTAQKVTLHWSTVLDATFGYFIASSRNDGIAPKEALQQLVDALMEQQHVSSIEISYPDDKTPPNDRLNKLGYGIQIVNPYGDKPAELNECDVEQDMLAELEGGSIGAIVYEEFPELIKFVWIDPMTYDLDSLTMNVNKLADFYEEFENEQKLMPILGRDEYRTKPFAS